jgi:hypothetical protein
VLPVQDALHAGCYGRSPYVKLARERGGHRRLHRRRQLERAHQQPSSSERSYRSVLDSPRRRRRQPRPAHHRPRGRQAHPPPLAQPEHPTGRPVDPRQLLRLLHRGGLDQVQPGPPDPPPQEAADERLPAHDGRVRGHARRRRDGAGALDDLPRPVRRPAERRAPRPAGQALPADGFIWVSADIAKGRRERWLPVLDDLVPIVEEIRLRAGRRVRAVRAAVARHAARTRSGWT